MTKSFGLESSEIQSNKTNLKDFPNIEAVVVYGSRALGDYRPNSDVSLYHQIDNPALIQHNETVGKTLI